MKSKKQNVHKQSFVISVEMADKVERIAKALKISISEVIEFFINRYDIPNHKQGLI